MDLTGIIISVLLGVISVLLGVLYRSSTNIVEQLRNLQIDFRGYQTQQSEHERRLQAIESRCMMHSGELRNIQISIAEGLKAHGS